eukprot:gene12778-biopygen15527
MVRGSGGVLGSGSGFGPARAPGSAQARHGPRPKMYADRSACGTSSARLWGGQAGSCVDTGCIVAVSAICWLGLIALTICFASMMPGGPRAARQPGPQHAADVCTPNSAATLQLLEKLHDNGRLPRALWEIIAQPAAQTYQVCRTIVSIFSYLRDYNAPQSLAMVSYIVHIPPCSNYYYLFI